MSGVINLSLKIFDICTPYQPPRADLKDFFSRIKVAYKSSLVKANYFLKIIWQI